MCTVSFVARRSGYALAMNRDEKRTRVAGSPPIRDAVNGRKVLNPAEPGGGTWIALNDGGATLALINWYSVTLRVPRNAASRGDVVRAVRVAVAPEEAGSALARLPLKRINPFRLIGVFPAAREVVEWRWDLRSLVRLRHRWLTRQWISSGFDEPAAQYIRGAAFRRARRQSTAGTLDWLRRLHRSHAPEAGPFSTCMHRADAATVSYTEVRVSQRRARMLYCAAPPCMRSGRDGRLELSLAIRVEG